MNTLIDADLPMSGDGQYPAVSLRSSAMNKPCNVPELAICYYVDVIVQSHEIIKTEGPNDDIVTLYDLTNLCETAHDDNLCTLPKKKKKSGEIDFPLSFSSAIQSNTFEQLHLNAYFDLHLHKFMIFGPCPHTKIYNFDDTIFISYAIIIVFLPSNYIGGNYRFINQNLEPIYPTNSTNIFLFGKNLNKMPTKLIIPFQHSLDDSPYFSYLFHDKYRITFELIKPAMKYFPSFLIYSAIFFK
ncbi:unnamed protein product [Rotaria sordida]|uniref:EDRF1 N-terminal domain-containing protein n=1 Tax=Rotaria sordida TaxID=392033 RepID=A0A819UH98_9BILA|nr:unnamed protein product [Rotaria sordida]